MRTMTSATVLGAALLSSLLSAACAAKKTSSAPASAPPASPADLVPPLGPMQLFVDSDSYVEPSTCIQLTATAPSGASLPSSFSESVSITTSSSTGHFYSDSACSTASTATAITNSGPATVFYADSTVSTGTTTLTASDTGTMGWMDAAFNVQIEKPTKLTFETGTVNTQKTTDCEVYSVGFVDAAANNVGVSGNVDLTLATSGASGTFYDNPDCTQAITIATVDMDTAAALFYFQSKTAGSFTLTATAGSSVSLPAASTTVTVTN